MIADIGASVHSEDCHTKDALGLVPFAAPKVVIVPDLALYLTLIFHRMYPVFDILINCFMCGGNTSKVCGYTSCARSLLMCQLSLGQLSVVTRLSFVTG